MCHLGEIQLEAVSLSLSEITADQPVSFTAEIKTRQRGEFALPTMSWPHYDVRFFASLDDIIDIDSDQELTYAPASCMRSLLGSAVQIFPVTLTLVGTELGRLSLHAQYECMY